MPSDDVPPTQVVPGSPSFAGRYRVDRPLGRGGMGGVDRPYDTVLGRYVALKRIAQDPGTRRAERLMREARAASALNHPHVVSVYDVGEADGVPFVVMELVEGGSLRARMEKGRVPLERALQWLRDVADALASAHRAGLVHRDVKPENLLLTADDRIKIGDFGASKELEQPFDAIAPTLTAPGQALTREGHVVGTPRYMAPEQLCGDALDGRADQFAWGLVAYE